jgi:hypothetical protein
MKTRNVVALAMMGFLVAALMMGLQVRADQDRAADNAALVEAADMALKATIAEHEAGKATIEDVYQWSQRLMTAERRAGKVDASSAHVQRMRQLHEKQTVLFKTGSVAGSQRKVFASKYYLVEAQIGDAK